MKHLSLNLEQLESRTFFSVTGGEVLVPPDSPPIEGGGDPQRSPAAYDAFLKIGQNSLERSADFFIKLREASPSGRSSDAFLKISENAAAKSALFFMKIPNSGL